MTKLSLLAVIVYEILAFSGFYIFYCFKNLEVAMATEILIVKYKSIQIVLYCFQRAYECFFSELASRLTLGDRSFPSRKIPKSVENNFFDRIAPKLWAFKTHLVPTRGTHSIRVVFVNDTRRRKGKCATSLSSTWKCWCHQAHWASLR